MKPQTLPERLREAANSELDIRDFGFIKDLLLEAAGEIDYLDSAVEHYKDRMWDYRYEIDSLRHGG